MQRTRNFFGCMMLGVLLGATTCAHAASNEAPTTSLFFTPDETAQINALVNKNNKNADASSIHLGAVMYYGPADWTLWLQGEQWTPATQHADLHVLNVQPDSVRLAVASPSDAASHEIAWHPHETYQIATDTVVEGDKQ